MSKSICFVVSVAACAALAVACDLVCPEQGQAPGPGGAMKKGDPKPVGDRTPLSSGEEMEIEDAVVSDVIAAVIAAHGEENRARVEQGVRQVAARWRGVDGTEEDLKDFCVKRFVADEEQLVLLFERFQENIEQVRGHLHEVRRFLKRQVDLDLGPVQEVDRLFAAYDLGAHVVEDLFRTKIGFLVLLNFPLTTLEEKLAQGGEWSREQWARARMTGMFESRVPPSVDQAITAAYVASDDYISNYNIYMHHLLSPEGNRPFPEGLKLISHWGLRDELKAQYADLSGLPRQKLIYQVMRAIISQEIPEAVIDNPHVDWVVAEGKVWPTKATDIDLAAHADKAQIAPVAEPEPDTRYAHLLDIFNAEKMGDRYHPTMPTYIDRKFQRDREIPRAEVERLLVSVLSAPVMLEVGAQVRKRLGRELEPFDIWYDGFRAGGPRSQEKLDEIVGRRYPTPEAFQDDLPNILAKLGFDRETAAFLSRKIVVDPSRGAGHAWGAERREDAAHLRTRIPEGGMKYKGYNIAIHELGHNVEQVFSLNKVDHYLLAGTPNTAFTEGFAFTFQNRDMRILELGREDRRARHLRALDTIWSTFEISGVALVDIRIWDWMYANPEATPAELKQAVVRIAAGVWDEFFQPVLGHPGEPILSIYSHIIDAGMYTPDYPIGLLIQFQMESYFAEHGLAGEMERMCVQGRVTPAAWMEGAVGGPISAEPLIKAAGEAVKAMGGR